MPQKRKMKTERGFTLIEVMVVVSIIGILATISTPHIIGSRRRARIRMCLVYLEEIRTAQDIYMKHHDTTAFADTFGALWDDSDPDNYNLSALMDVDGGGNLINYGCEITNPGPIIGVTPAGTEYTVEASPLSFNGCTITVSNRYSTRLYDGAGFTKIRQMDSGCQ